MRLDARVSNCPHCGRDTPTVAGRCPHCGGPKAPLPPRRERARPSFWSGLDDLALWLLAVVPGAVLWTALTVLAGIEALIALAIVVAAVGLAGVALSGC